MTESRIAIFGGTFDPVHLGHLHIAAVARDAMALDEVRFVPCRISPHKSGMPPASAQHRAAMLKAATHDFPWAVVDERELQREEPSFSWQTAESFRAEFPDARLFWLMGADQWDALPRWTHPEKLAACVEFIVFPRAGITPQARPGYVLHTLVGVHPASATGIRNADGTAGGWLPPDVAAWIETHGLYR
ncbi:MAG: nicotinate (nicotinamide) nucleotide adenylyltransferase [Verrucomicrobiota bacterium]